LKAYKLPGKLNAKKSLVSYKMQVTIIVERGFDRWAQRSKV